MQICLHCKLPVFIVILQLNVNFFDRFSKNSQTSNFLMFRPVEAELLHADGQADMTKLIFGFGSFWNTPKIAVCCGVHTKHKFRVWAEC